MRHKFSYRIQTIDLVMVAVSLALIFYDMTNLQAGLVAMNSELFASPTNSIIAAAIAIVADVFAFDWGMRNGRNKSTRVFNKKSMPSFLMWVIFGIVYAFIESAGIMASAESESFNLVGTIGQSVFLAISYISSGVMLQIAGRDMFDADAAACRASESEYKIYAMKAAKEDSRIKYMLGTLENYHQNFKSLDEQYEKQLEAINHAEDSVLNEVLGKMLQNNPTMNVEDARAVIRQAREDFEKGIAS